MSSSPSNLIKFDKNKSLLGGNAAIGIDITSSAAQPDIGLALVNDSPFPARQIQLGQIAVNADAGKDIKFVDGAASVTFSASASANAGMGVYLDSNSLLSAVQLNDNLSPGVNLGTDANDIYMLLQWGYDLNASTKGAVAFGAPGSVTFGGSASRDATYAIIRRIPKTTGARTAITDLVNSWRLPSQVSGPNELEPGTWLIAEVDGSLALNLGAQFGYDYNWIRQAQLGGLSGDIGLRLQLAVAATFGFQASGKFALVVGRESDDPNNQSVRLRLFKQRIKGWNFAFNASANAQPVSFLPATFDGFIQAVFGLHGEQIIKDLNIIRQWTDPNQNLADLMSGVGVDYAQQFLQQVTGIDPATLFNEAKSRLVGFLNIWNNLPQQLSSMLLKFVDEKVDLSQVQSIAQAIASGNQASITTLLNKLLNQVDFFQTPEGRWLEAAADKGILKALSSLPEFQKLQKAASLTTQVLDGSLVQGVLVKLQTYVNQRLRITQIENIVNQTSFNSLDLWLKKKLSAFLGQELDLAALNGIRQTINSFLAKGPEFYNKAVQALARNYTFSLNYTYEQATTGTALIDMVFDLSQTGAAALLKQALSGDFDTLLTTPAPGVTLNTAELTHQINRQSHVELTLPFLTTALDHINSAMAQVKAVDEDEGRVLVYDLDASDLVTVKNRRNSRLAIGGFMNVPANQVYVHSTEALNYSYSLRQVKQNMSQADLQFQLKPYVDSYLSGVFNTDGASSFETWVGDMAAAVDKLENNGANNFGNTLVSLDVSLPARVASAWLNAPADKKSPVYQNMSSQLQLSLRRLIPFTYFQDVTKYKDIVPASALLVYASLPPVMDPGDIYWDFQDPNKRANVAGLQQTLTNLTAMLGNVFNLLSATPGMQSTAGFFNPNRAGVIQGEAIQEQFDNQLRSLYFTEASVVRGAAKAGLALAQFLQTASSQPTDAIAALANFGSNITDTFNQSIKSLYGGDAVRPLGSLAFIEAARTLDPTLGQITPLSMLDLIVVKQQSTFQLPTFLDSQMPQPSDIVAEQRLVSLQS